MSSAARKVVLLGPQHPQPGLVPDVGNVLRALHLEGKIALITAGWQERESEDKALKALLGVPAVNLTLHARSEDVFAKEKLLSTAYKERQRRLRILQDFYRIRIDHADDAARAISVRHVEPALLEEERQISFEMTRTIDEDHLDRCQAIHQAFEAKWHVGENPTVAKHKKQLAELIEPCTTVVIAGGHVASLLNRMRLFDVMGLAAGKHVVAWSAGAMVLSDRIVLFHDYPPYGKGLAEMFDRGHALARGFVVLPDPRLRIRQDDKSGIERFARRVAPATVVALDYGARLVFENGELRGGVAHKLCADGTIDPTWRVGAVERPSAPAGHGWMGWPG